MPQFCFEKDPVYILDAVRTPVGSPFKSLKDFSPGELGAFVVAALVERSGLKPQNINEVILGETVMAGSGQNPGRQAAVMAGLLPSTTAFTVNNVCGAGLQAVILGGQTIALGSGQCVIALGAESASRTPQMFSKMVEGTYSGREPVDSLFYDGLWCPLSGKPMGEICENMAQSENISREDQDNFALESHRRAASANFQNEILEIPLGDSTVFSADERIRRRISLENFASLPPAFMDQGSVTSGNASVPSDGSAGVLLANEKFIQTYKVKPLARLLGFASIALEPHNVFKAAVPAVQSCLKACELSLKDIDLFEVSEAFAAQAIYTRDTLKISSDKMNVSGGDLALGHPLGAAGTRILVTLIHSLRVQNKKYGLAVICYGGGGAIAVVVKYEK